MNELAKHIERLLLENDCVIIPHFGGFVAHYTSAQWKQEEGIFLAPARIIGFNPQLTLNDGLLAQSYMELYGISFADAGRQIEQAVQNLVSVLHEEGKAELPNIGALSYSVHQTYEFLPYDERLTSPVLYGLSSFEMRELSELRQPLPQRQSMVTEVSMPKRKKTYDIHINRTLLHTVASTAAAILLFFLLSSPVENTYVEEANYATLMPAELFGKIEKHSLLMTSIGTSTPQKVERTQKTKIVAKEVNVHKEAPIEKVKAPVKEIEAPVKTVKPVQATTDSKPFNIIVASLDNVKDAERMVNELKSKGYSDAHVVSGKGKVRVSIFSYASREEAEAALPKLRQTTSYSDAWMLRAK